MHTTAIQTAIKCVNGQAALARLLGVAPPTIHQWAQGTRPVPPKKCVVVERITNGAVTRKDLRPNDWREIWPELAHGHLSNDQRAAVDAVFAAKAVEVIHG